MPQKTLPKSLVRSVNANGIIHLQPGQLPIVFTPDLSEGKWSTLDRATEISNPTFIPLRLDSYVDDYTGFRHAMVSAILLDCILPSGGKLPAGAIICLRLKTNRSSKGALNTFESLDSIIELSTGRHRATWAWQATLERKTGTGVNATTGLLEPRKWYVCLWNVRELEGAKEEAILQEIGIVAETDPTFESLVSSTVIQQLIPIAAPPAPAPTPLALPPY